jgi:hypothetical protein
MGDKKMTEKLQKNPTGRFNAPEHWDAEILSANPIFADLCAIFPFSEQTVFPTVDTLNQWFRQVQPQASNVFVADDVLAADGRYYEVFIHQTGQIPTRLHNWHDLFGALIWCLMPKTKNLLNQLHMQEIAQHGQLQRSKLRNKLTLLDECGVILAYSKAATPVMQQLRQHQWHEAFVQARAQWHQVGETLPVELDSARIQPMMFGHANYEMATRPFIGLTGKMLALELPATFWQLSLLAQYHQLDESLSIQIANGDFLLQAAHLTPLPLLGLPGWYPANISADFYLDQQYFRPLPTHRQHKMASVVALKV